MSTPMASRKPATAPAATTVRLRVSEGPRRDESKGDRRFATPSFLASAGIHCLLVLVLGLSIYKDFGGPGGTKTLNATLGEAHDGASGDGDDSASDSSVSVSSSGGSAAGGGPASAEAMAAAVGAALDDAPPGDPGAMLPSAAPAGLGPGGGLDGVLGGGGGKGGGGSGLTAGGGPRRGGPGGNGETSVFGVKGTGRSFVYVFDRSGSMGGSGRSPLLAAKEQMLYSIDNLVETNRFQIVYYNQKPTAFNPAGAGRLAFASDSNKSVARHFVNSVQADGATDHELALNTALALGPDAIFFLTDADDPLNAKQMDEIRRRNAGQTAINCIEFGLGRPLGRPSFLAQLAKDNGGNYGYIDITTFGAGK